VLADLVDSTSEFGARRDEIHRDPAQFFPIDRVSTPDFWQGQERLLAHLRDNLARSVTLIERYFPPVADRREIDVTVVAVPGLTICYGAGGATQVFGLFDGAEPAEALLFLAHTHYHELSERLRYPAPPDGREEDAAAGSLRRLIMQLIRNEGVANYAVLPSLRRLREAGVTLRYFDYAPLVDNVAATTRAMIACRELVGQITSETVGRLLPKVDASFKNPRLPIINLVGIHMAEAIAVHHGEPALLDVDGRSPEEFFLLYEASDDELRKHLFGSGGFARFVTV